MTALTQSSPIVADAYALFLAFGGRRHRHIEMAMRAKGYERFNRRVLYDRFERGRLRLGWIRRFKWNVIGSEPPALAGGMTRPVFDRPMRPLETKRPPSVQPSDAKLDPQKNSDPATAETMKSDTAASLANEKGAETQPNKETEMKAFRNWLKRVSPGMSWDWRHQQYLYDKLADVTSGKTKRLMIFMPPRHGKSELVTVRYPAYRLKQDATLNIIIGSYNQRLANRFSRKVRIAWEDSTQMENGEVRIENEKQDRSQHQLRSQTSSRGQAASVEKQTSNGGSDNSQFSTLNSHLPPRRLNTVSEWETGMGGGVRAVGVGAGITGYGGKLVIIDDPIKSRAEAESETFRNRSWEWFNDDIYTRLEPDAAIILIQTRWHEDDLAGRLLEEMKNGGEQWEVVSLPAIAEAVSTAETPKSGKEEETGIKGIQAINAIKDEPNILPSSSSPSSSILSPSSLSNICDPIGRRPGDALCPERFPLAELARIRRQLGEYSFSSLYQQRPMPLEGGLFKKKWFTQIVEVAPRGLRWFRGYDLAISTKTSADFTASARCSIDRHGNLYIADVFRARLEYPDQRKFVVDRLRSERDTEHGIESALHAQAFIQDLRREPSLARHAIRLVRVTSDKFTRALAWANRAEEGKVFLVRGPWLKTFLDEVTSFPNAAHDDQVDAVSLAVQMMESRRRQFWRF